MNKIIRNILSPKNLIRKVYKYLLLFLPDKLFLKAKYRLELGKKLDLKNPKTFNEKLQWLKLYNRHPEYTIMVDKYSVKDYVASRIGMEHIIPTLGVWDKVEDIEWDKLPNQFVLKCTHDSAGLLICRDKSKINKAEAIKKLRRGLKRDYYRENREWPYKNVPHRIIAEKYIEDETGQLRDYKFFCFDGCCRMFKIDFDRFTDHHANYFSTDGKILPFGEYAYSPKPEKKLTLPSQLKTMLSLAEILSKGIPFLRVDFYQVNDIVYFGELTFYPASGLGKWTEDIWDEKIGEMIILPKA